MEKWSVFVTAWNPGLLQRQMTSVLYVSFLAQLEEMAAM